MASRQNTGTRRRTDGACRVGIGESHSRSSKCVDVWRFVELASEATHVRPAEIIDQKENEIFWFESPFNLASARLLTRNTRRGEIEYQKAAGRVILFAGVLSLN